MIDTLYIRDWQSISALGHRHQEIWNAYLDDESYLKTYNGYISAPIQNPSKLDEIRSLDRRYKRLDPAVLMGQWCALQLKKRNTLTKPLVNVGSSRGATATWESQYTHFLTKKQCKVDASPSTTLGNISSWIGQIMENNEGVNFSHSITCSSFHHAMLNAAAWIGSGMAQEAIIGASEAPLTPFGLEQMVGLGIYAKQLTDYPVKAFKLDKEGGSMALGEAACLFVLDHEKNDAQFAIRGWGWGAETISHGSSISDNGLNMQKAMKMALDKAQVSSVDIVITHSPGTYKGDLAEYEAIKSVFQDMPACTNNKWKIGHSFGASGGMSLEMALLMLKEDQFIPLPYLDEQKEPEQIRRIMVNTVGFGGNAVSVIVEKC